MSLLVLRIFITWLPEKSQISIYQLLLELSNSINLFDQEASNLALMKVRANFMIVSDSKWVLVWLICSVVMGVMFSWLVQVLISGLQQKWRYVVGITVFILIWTSIWKALIHISLPKVGCILGFVSGQFFGWWAAIGYRKVDQRYSDARTVRRSFKKVKPYAPLKYINLRKGIFLGLKGNGQPHYIKLSDARKHVQLLGETRCGKTVAATILLAQAALLKETVIVLDPKADKFSSGVLKAAAERANVAFIYIDLRPDQPAQLNVLMGATDYEIEELLISCFDLASKGTDADVYRVEDRAAARKLAKSGAKTLNEMLNVGMDDKQVHGARKFWEDLQELASHPVTQTSEGWNLKELVGTPCVIYIVGSKTHDNTIRLQKLILLRILQIIDRYGIKIDANWTALFIDELKYVLCGAALRALGTVADRNCHMTIAHQALGDLRDVGSLDPGAVYGAVVVNTSIKLFYKANDPETAKWGADLSGDVPTYQESIAKNPATNNSGTFQEGQRPLFEKNLLLALPPLTGVLFGAGVAEQISVSYLPSSLTPAIVSEAKSEKSPDYLQGVI